MSGTKDDVTGEGFVLGRKVRSEMAATALAPRQRAFGDEPRQERRGMAEPFEPVSAPNDTGVLPEGVTEGGCHRRLGLR